MQEKVGEQGRLISPCLKAGALRHILVTAQVVFPQSQRHSHFRLPCFVKKKFPVTYNLANFLPVKLICFPIF